MILGICLGTVKVSDEPVTRAPSNPYRPIVDPDTNALSRISSRPRIPPFETKMPETILQLLKQHVRHGLDAYKNVKPKKHWGHAKEQGFAKRQYMFEKIKDRVSSTCPNVNF